MNMKPEQWWSSLPRGIRLLLAACVLIYVISILAEWSDAYDVPTLLGLSGRTVWAGEIWRLFTHLFISANIFDLLMNGVALAVFGPRLQKAWTAGQFWSYCAIVGAATAAAKVFLLPRSDQLFMGLSGVTIGLLAAWLKLFGQEQVLAFGVYQTTVRNIVLIAGVILLIAIVSSGGATREALVPFAGGFAGFFYLTMRWRQNMAAQNQWRGSQRIGRLEL